MLIISNTLKAVIVGRMKRFSSLLAMHLRPLIQYMSETKTRTGLLRVPWTRVVLPNLRLSR